MRKGAVRRRSPASRLTEGSRFESAGGTNLYLRWTRIPIPHRCAEPPFAKGAREPPHSETPSPAFPLSAAPLRGSLCERELSAKPTEGSDFQSAGGTILYLRWTQISIPHRCAEPPFAKGALLPQHSASAPAPKAGRADPERKKPAESLAPHRKPTVKEELFSTGPGESQRCPQELAGPPRTDRRRRAKERG